MPVLEYVVLADYVRQDAGVTHLMGAGIDTFAVASLPARVPAGIAARISFGSTDEVGAAHEFQLILQGPDGPLFNAAAHFATPDKPAGTPEHWRTGLVIALKVALPIPAHSDYYSLEFIIDGDQRLSRSLDVRAVPVPGQQQP